MYGQSENQREDGMVAAPSKLLTLLVPEEGLEPSRGLTPPDFESGASAIPPLRHEDLRRDYNNFFGNLFQTALVFVGSAFGADINPARTQALIASRGPKKKLSPCA